MIDYNNHKIIKVVSGILRTFILPVYQFFSQNRFTKAFELPFATYPTFTVIAATRS